MDIQSFFYKEFDFSLLENPKSVKPHVIIMLKF